MISAPGTAEAMWDRVNGDRVCIGCHGAVHSSASINVAVDGIQTTSGTLDNSGGDSIEIDWMFQGSTFTDNKEASGVLIALPKGWSVENGTLNAPSISNWSTQWDNVDGGQSWAFLTDSFGDCPAGHECYAVHFTGLWDHDAGVEDMACNMGPVACDGGAGGTDLDGVRNRFGTDAIVRPYPGAPEGNYTVLVYGIGYDGTSGGSVNQTINVTVNDSGTVVAKSPASLVNDSSNGGSISWNAPGNASAQDNTYADADNMDGNTSSYLKATNFGFAIPESSTIDGIVVEVDGYAQSPGAVSDAEVKIVRNGLIRSQNKAAAGYWAESDTNDYRVYGGPSDLWGESWTPAEINSPDFGVVLSVSENGSRTDVYVDHVRVTVYYSTGGAGGGNRILYTVPSSGVNIASGIQTNHGSCGNDPSSSYREELSTDLNDMCTSNYRYEQSSVGLHSEHFFNTEYTAATTITGDSYQFTIRDGGTFGIRLFYILPDGDRTYLGTEVSQSNPQGSSNNYTVNLSGQSGTVPAGAKLGLRTRLVSLSGSSARVYLGNPDGRTGNISGKLIINETAGGGECTDGQTQPCGTSDIGECQFGVQTCSGGFWGACVGNIEPAAEVCDNLDNDCDGSTDENLTRPTTCGVGECAGNTGQETCTSGTWGNDTCDPLAGAAAEVCDNLDNDCDGAIDDNLTRPTTCGVGECAGNMGEETCAAGTWGGDTCDPLAGATAEVCDTLDNDCDGATDEDLTRPTTCGVGECGATGVETCSAGTWGGDTCTPGTPSPELCDGLDNNCNDSVDEDFSNLGTGCTAGVGACETSGSYICSADGLGTECDAAAGTPAPDDSLCNGIDDDCDGSTDEDFASVQTTCGTGECASTGQTTCVGGVEGDTCTPGIPGVEGPEGDPTCTDTLDNDCDGLADEVDNDCGAYIAPPVRQELGRPDSTYNDLVEADCRFCHENPDQFPVDPEIIPDRHHLLYNTPVRVGTCSQTNSFPCQDDSDCPAGELCINGSDAPFPPPIGGNYDCFTCHDVDCSSGDCGVMVFRDCLICHIQNPLFEYTVHHRTSLAQGTLPQGPDCQFCHGSFVDNRDDGHQIPSYTPQDQTPLRSGGTGIPLNSRGNGAGACDYCHDSGVSPEGVVVVTNQITHHNRGYGFDDTKCDWCHDFTLPFEAQIRICENCHGFETLHSIQADSDGDGVISAGIEQPFYGHIGNPDDCWGCHGYSVGTVAPASGAVVPNISGISDSVLIEGISTAVTITGSAFTNIDVNTGAELTSSVLLTADDDSALELIPDTVSESTMNATFPSTLTRGNYRVQAVKQDKLSNPVNISIKPAVIITDVTCDKKKKLLIITGAGFSEKVEGTDAYISAKADDILLSILSWTDTRIVASVTRCSKHMTVTVDSIFGSYTWSQGKGKRH